MSTSEKILVTKQRLIRAKKAYGKCVCSGKYCGHSGTCGKPLGQGWRMRLSPPTTEFGEPRLLTPDQFEFLLSGTTALCRSCACQCPNPLFDPS